jgi:hypothetical protein
MGLITGTPIGSLINPESIYLEGAPYIYFQDYTANELNNPDAQTYYWGLSGTSTYPVYLLGCVSNVSLSENITINQVRCDNIGDVASVQRRHYLQFSLEIQTIFPLSVLAHVIKSPQTTYSAGGLQKMGVGSINNNQFYHIYAPKVYDDVTGDYVSFTLHKAQFVDAFSLAMTMGTNWKLSGLKIMAYADDTKPANQLFATIIRADQGAIP